jgi:peptide/nickel transport system permease protein
VVRYLITRIASAVTTLFILSILIFVLIRALPGGPAVAILGLRATPDLIARINHDFGVDQPLPIQYLRWLGAALHGDLGYSLSVTGFTSGQSQPISGRPVADIVLQGLLVTVPLTLLGTFLAAILGMTGGILAVVKRGTVWDAIVSNTLLVGISFPDFYVAFLLILLFTVNLGLLPSIGFVSLFDDPVNGLRSVALPVIAIGLINAAAIGRMTRASLLEALTNEYVWLARARGTFESVVLLKHALRNALIPVVTVIGLQMGYLFGGVIVLESMFGLPGIGRQLLIAVSQRDYPTIQAIVLTFAAAFILVNLIVDLTYPLFDPRIRTRG